MNKKTKRKFFKKIKIMKALNLFDKLDVLLKMIFSHRLVPASMFVAF